MTKDNLISLLQMAEVELKKLGSKENDLLFAIKNAYGYLMAEQSRQAAVSGSLPLPSEIEKNQFVNDLANRCAAESDRDRILIIGSIERFWKWLSLRQ